LFQRAINIQRLETSIQANGKYWKFKRRNRDLYHVTSIEQTSFKAELCKIIAIIVIVFTPVFIDFKGSIIEYQLTTHRCIVSISGNGNNLCNYELTLQIIWLLYRYIESFLRLQFCMRILQK